MSSSSHSKRSSHHRTKSEHSTKHKSRSSTSESFKLSPHSSMASDFSSIHTRSSVGSWDQDVRDMVVAVGSGSRKEESSSSRRKTVSIPKTPTESKASAERLERSGAKHRRTKSTPFEVKKSSSSSKGSDKRSSEAMPTSPQSHRHSTRSSIQEVVKRKSAPQEKRKSSSSKNESSSKRDDASSKNARLEKIRQHQGIENIEMPLQRSKPKSSPLPEVSHSDTSESSETDSSSDSSSDDSEADEPEVIPAKPTVVKAPNSIPDETQELTPTRTDDSSTTTVNTPALWTPARYIPGPIRVQHSFGLYVIPMMTAMDVLSRVEAVTEEQVIDDVIDYFDSFGFPQSPSAEEFQVSMKQAPSNPRYELPAMSAFRRPVVPPKESHSPQPSIASAETSSSTVAAESRPTKGHQFSLSGDSTNSDGRGSPVESPKTSKTYEQEVPAKTPVSTLKKRPSYLSMHRSIPVPALIPPPIPDDTLTRNSSARHTRGRPSSPDADANRNRQSRSRFRSIRRMLPGRHARDD